MKRFGDIPEEFAELSSSKIVVVPVPYDGTSTWIKGANKGPDALLEASANMELYDIETDSEVYKHGIFTAKPVLEKENPKKMVHAVYQSVTEYIKQEKFVVTLGGEHSVTIGSVIAHAENFPGMSVLQLDAHTDLRPEYEESIYNHACVMARVKEICPFVQVGIRSMDVEENIYINQGRIFYAEDIVPVGNTVWMDKLLEGLSENVYITIDLDVFDPSIMPSTGTPEPGGMSWYSVLELLRKVNDNRNIVGFDVVELCPNENNPAPDFLAAKLTYKLLSYKFKKVYS